MKGVGEIKYTFYHLCGHLHGDRIHRPFGHPFLLVYRHGDRSLLLRVFLRLLVGYFPFLVEKDACIKWFREKLSTFWGFILTVWNFYFDLLAVHGSSVKVFDGDFCISFISHCDETVTFAGIENIILKQRSQWLFNFSKEYQSIVGWLTTRPHFPNSDSSKSLGQLEK